MVSFNLFGEFDNFEDLDKAEEKRRRESQKEEMRHEEITREELNDLEFKLGILPGQNKLEKGEPFL